jgi:glycosyltransferase involved in cell wall biosynthesis
LKTETMLCATIIVPTYNRAHLLPTVLSAVGEQDQGEDYEIVVVDDGSRDETPQVLEEWCRRLSPRMRAFRQENSGPAKARNRGASAARGRLLVFLDDDCVPESSWLRSLEGRLEASGAAAVAGAVINREDDWVGRYIKQESVIGHVVSENGSVTELVTGNVGVRAHIFREIGGFDEAIRVAGGEDTEFSLSLRAAGHHIVYAPEARVRHESHVGLSGYLRMIFRHGRGRRRLGERFPHYRLRLPHLRLLWLAWPLRQWLLKDFLRYRSAAVPATEALRYVLLRYLQNLARVAGYIRGT